jgi:hypothetical protein
MKKKADNLSAIGLRWEDAMSVDRPLQPTTGGETDHKSLIDDVRLHEAKKELRAERPRTRSPAASSEAKKSLEATIDELEEFLSRFEKH